MRGTDSNTHAFVVYIKTSKITKFPQVHRIHNKQELNKKKSTTRLLFLNNKNLDKEGF